MTLPFGLGISARDVTISFKNACNCCGCCEGSPSLDARAYVNHRGEAEYFSEKKAAGDVHRAFQRSLINLEKHVEWISHQSFCDVFCLKNAIEMKTGFYFNTQNPQVLNFGVIAEINAVFEEVFN